MILIKVISQLNDFFFTKEKMLMVIIAFFTTAIYAQVTYEYKGIEQIYTVPENVQKIRIEAWGAQGGTEYGGKGGYASGELVVQPRQLLYIYVGGQGSTTSTANGSALGGWNGGGNGGSGIYGSSGGGGTDVRVWGNTLEDRVIVAGGGGGTDCYDTNFNSYHPGGTGGGEGAEGAGKGDYGTIVPTAGTQYAGGTGGSDYIYIGEDGSFGQGGMNASFEGDYSHGGGGGGGYYGGGGGQPWCSGAGGSSYTGGVTNGATIAGVRTGNGLVVISMVCEITTTTDIQSACDSLTWMDGVTYTESTNTPTYTLTGSNGCDSIIVLDLTIRKADTSLEIDGKTLLANAFGASYQWFTCSDNGTEPIPNETGPSFTASYTGDYAVEVYQDGCVGVSDCQHVTITGSLNQETFNFTGEEQIYTVPANVYKVLIEAWGAQGGTEYGGEGGFALGELEVTPGQVLYVYVGGQGSTTATANGGALGGWNGGGNGGSGIDGSSGGGGTDVRSGGNTLTDRIIVAGGGGGTDYSGFDYPPGGTGGGEGAEGAGKGEPIVPTAGTQNAGGAGGSYYTDYTDYIGEDGSLGQGGMNSPFGSNTITYMYGGGGGGGYYGGGGGHPWCSGAGGSSFIGGVTNGTMTAGGRTGNGMVVISPVCELIQTVDVQSACDSLTWIDGVTYTESTNLPTYTLVNSIGCDSIVTLNLTINTVDTSVTIEDNTLHSNAVGASYQWLTCGDNGVEPIPNETGPSFAASYPGDYAVEVHQNGCVAVSDCQHNSLYHGTFDFTGAEQIYKVPANVHRVLIEAYGAQGGTEYGGEGGYASGELDVTPGQVLYVYVGGQGSTTATANGGSLGGWNGGGNGGSGIAGSSGGGATDVRAGGNALEDRVIVAGGGGGVDLATNNPDPIYSPGGTGGGTGEEGAGKGDPIANAASSTAGTQDAGGKGGIPTDSNLSAAGVGEDGSLGQGGRNAIYGGTTYVHGGGGGGGYYGGGGGHPWCSGAGGSSYIGGVTNGIMIAGGRTGNGRVLISDIITGLPDEGKSKPITSVYPNPTNGLLNIELAELSEQVTVRLRNMLGNTVVFGAYSNVKNIEVDIKGDNGVYLIEVISSNGKKSFHKVIKNK